MRGTATLRPRGLKRLQSLGPRLYPLLPTASCLSTQHVRRLHHDTHGLFLQLKLCIQQQSSHQAGPSSSKALLAYGIISTFSSDTDLFVPGKWLYLRRAIAPPKHFRAGEPRPCAVVATVPAGTVCGRDATVRPLCSAHRC